jgi:hypothetical protein
VVRGSPPPRVSLIDVVRLSVYLPRNARALMRARQLGGQIKYLSQGEIEARNRGYSPYSVETWRTWEYWANKAGCGHLLTRPDGMRTRQKADPQIGRFPLGAIADADSPSPPRGGSGERVPTGEEAGFSLGVPMVRIHLPPGESRVRTCMLAELDQTGESQISLTDPDSRAMAAHTILRRRFDPPRVQQSYAARRFSRMTTLDKRRQIQAQPEPPGRRSAAKHLDARRPRPAAVAALMRNREPAPSR